MSRGDSDKLPPGPYPSTRGEKPQPPVRDPEADRAALVARYGAEIADRIINDPTEDHASIVDWEEEHGDPYYPELIPQEPKVRDTDWEDTSWKEFWWPEKW